MPAYLYPITIKRSRKKLQYQTQHTFEDQETLSLEQLLPIVGKNYFDAERDKYNCYQITVYHSRLETADECKTRVAREVAYMEEYKKRKNTLK